MKTRKRQGKAAEKSPNPKAGPNFSDDGPEPSIGAEDTEDLGDTKERPDEDAGGGGFASGGVLARLRRATNATEQSPNPKGGPKFKDDPPTPSDGGADTRNVSGVDEREDQDSGGEGFAGEGGGSKKEGGLIARFRKAAGLPPLKRKKQTKQKAR